MTIQQHKPMHPGAFLKRVYMDPFGIGSNKLALKLQVSPGLVSRLINEKTKDNKRFVTRHLFAVSGCSPSQKIEFGPMVFL